jgi:glycosyltransferase involved in cell wall biosynthesis
MVAKPPLIMLAYVYPPDNYVGAARPARLVKYLGRAGYSVSVIAAGPERGCHTMGNVYRVRGEMLHAPRKSFSGLIEKAARILVFRHDEGLTWIPRAVSLASRWDKLDPKPVLLSTSPPVSTHLAALTLKKRFGWSWIADFRDPLAGNPSRATAIARRVDAPVQRAIFRHADAIIANTDAVLELWLTDFPQYRPKFSVIWNGFDPEEPMSAAPIPFRPYRVLAHVGTVYPERSPALLLSSARRLVESGHVDPRTLRIKLIGLLDFAAVSGSGDFDFLSKLGCLESVNTWMPRQQAQQIVASADYLMLLDWTESHAALQVPAKLFEYIRVGRPILACTKRESPSDRILRQCGIPHAALYPDAPPAENDRRLAAFLAEPSSVTAPSEWFQTQFDAEAQARALSRLIEQVQ